MKFYIDDKECLSLSDMQKRIIADYMPADQMASDLERRIYWLICDQLLRAAAAQLRRKWEPILIKEGSKQLPVSDEDFAALVVSRPDYEDAAARIAKKTADDRASVVIQ